MNTPILLITFNRPKYVTEVLKSLKKANVKNLYIFKDGPRPNNLDDKIKSKEIEHIIGNIDWDCKITTNFLNNNLGCGYGPFTAISWVFQYTEEVIILEDDCIPSQAFFKYISYLLEKYRYNERVRHISGFNMNENHEIFKKYDYIFTQYAHTWGWATWKRVWDNFSLNESYEIKPFFKSGGFKNQFSSNIEASYFNNYYFNRPSPLKEAFHSWDYQFAVHSRINGGLAICPSRNLITNIGIEGTHTSLKHDNRWHFQHIANENFEILKEPNEVKLIPEFEEYYFKNFYPITYKSKLKSIINKIKYKIINKADF